MRICYVDESGDAEPLRSAIPNSTPAFVLLGVTVPEQSIKDLTWDFLQLKKKFNPSLTGRGVQLSDVIRFEMKGSKLRVDIRKGSRNQRRRAELIIGATFDLLDQYDCTLVGKVVIKRLDPSYSTPDPAVYGKAVGEMATLFETQLAAPPATPGIMVLDARTKVKNAPNVHTITTQRFKAGGNAYPHIIESPVFGHSDTHVPLQIADLLASAVVFPIACHQYCSAHSWNHHPHEHYGDIKNKFGSRLKKLEYRFTDAAGVARRGLAVDDPVGGRSVNLLF